MKKIISLFAFLIVLYNITNAQLKYYEVSFNGGVTSGGWSPNVYGSGTGNFSINIAPGSTILKAFLIASRLGGGSPNYTVTLNGTPHAFSLLNQVTTFTSLYGGGGLSAVHVIDVTANINPLVNNYTLVAPAQGSSIFQDFKLIVYYQNNLYPTVNTALFINTDNLNQPNHVWNLNFVVPINSGSDVAFSFFNSYQCNMAGDAERVYVNGTLLGMTGNNDLNSGGCTGTLGNMYYQNNALTSLGDDNANQGVNQYDALSNSMALIPNNSTTVTVGFQHNGGGQDNHQWSVLVVYGGCSLPIAGTVTAAPLSICEGDSSLLTLTGSSGTIQWQASTDGGSTWNNIPGAINTTYNTSALTTTTCFRAAVTSCGTTVYSNQICVTVNPTPAVTATPANQTICSGNNTSIVLTSNVPGTTFNWTVVQVGVTGASNGTGNNITQTLTSANGGTATYTITPSANGCIGLPIIVTITVDAQPSIANAGPNQQLCANSTTLAGNTPLVGNGLWSLVGGSGTIVSPNSPASGVNGMGIGVNQFQWTITNGVCPPSLDIVDITVNPMPVPSFTSAIACPNQSTSFTNTTPGGIVSLNWSFPGATPSSGTGNNPSTTYPSGGTYNVTLIVTATGGCVDSITQQIIVPYTPVADFNFTQVCVGNATSFSNLSSVQNGSITGAQWVFGDGSPVDNSMNPSHTYANCGTYTVTLIVTSNDGCAASITKQVEVYCLPVASFTVNNVCDGNDASFVNTSQNGIAYSWNFGDGNTSTAQNPFHTYAAPGTYTVTLIVNNGPGCSDVFTSTVTIHPKPVADFNAPNACDGNLISFNNTSSILSGSIIGNAWNFGDGNSSTAQNPTHTYANSNIYNVTLIVVSDMGCTDTLTKPVTIYPNPVVSFNASDVCEGNAIAFAGSSSIIIGSSWNWNFGDGASGSGQNTSHNYAAPGAYSVTLVVTTANGCVDSVSKIVNVFQTPSASFAADTTSGCAPLCVNFTNLSSIGDNSPLTYAWNFGNGNGSSNTNGSQCYQNTGTTPLSFTVSLTVTSDKGCTDTYSQNNLITVFPVPIADFNMDRDSVSVFDPRIQFFDQSYGAISQYQWNFGGLGSSNDKNPDFSFPDTGAFNVTLWVTNSYGCSSSITKTIKVGAEFSIFIPNAFTPDADHKNEIFKPVGYGIQDSGYNFYIFDRWGELIFESHNLAEGWNGRAKNGSNLSPVGVYIWKLQFKDINNKTHSMMGHVSLIN
ncbi:MAG: PKD domain-containing protein [Bacteroidetes bacterium]|nr:PKD domain-containing protein [Bacteroidota bacterium]NOG94643.1 PKD domain-containing protein [Bacteroidota bacterium]WKZ75734.1 MAG: PKD domain-containing protein [Vicingaceae bacterium]GIK69069.1 MAG: hypothetical protein BroJett020_03640 [Bacteroidota bacterium]CAG0996628.1 Collagenase ColH [Flavobacteriales bacterium]